MLYNTKNNHGGDIYNDRISLDFSVSINPFGTPEGVRKAIRKAADQTESYPDPFCTELVKAISDAENVPKEWILCSNGSAELIYSYCRVKKGCMAFETAPAFSEYSIGTEMAGGTVIRYPLKEEQGFVLDREFIVFLQEKTVLPFEGPKAVFLCNPNNPDGRNISMPLLEEILEWCAGHETSLFLDECFLEMSDNAVSMKTFLKDHPELFLLKAFTKSYGMAGIRLGYGLCSDTELLMQISRMSQPWNVSVPAQAAGIAALKEKEWISKARKVICEERAWISAELENLGFQVNPSEANYILMHGKPGLDRALRKQGIAVRSCADFHNLGEGWYRIGLKLHADNVKLIQALRNCLSYSPETDGGKYRRS